jgi:regulatory protein
MARPLVSLKARALRYLSMREHSRLELARKLQRHALEGEDVAALLDWLENAKFLSQSRFVESLVHRRSARFGNNRIVQELQSHGIQGDVLGEVKSSLQADETRRAREVWLAKFGAPASDAEGRAKQIRFLMQRGFSHRAISAAMKSRGDEDDAGMADES